MSGKGKPGKGVSIKFNLGGQSLAQKLQASRARQSQLQTQIIQDQVAAGRQAAAPPAAAKHEKPTNEAEKPNPATAKVHELGAATQHLPVGLRLKRVLETLFEAQRPLKAPEILEGCKVNVLEVELRGQLKKHERIVIEAGRFSYRCARAAAVTVAAIVTCCCLEVLYVGGLRLACCFQQA